MLEIKFKQLLKGFFYKFTIKIFRTCLVYSIIISNVGVIHDQTKKRLLLNLTKNFNKI